jgi:hypothetical protein
MVTLRSRVVVDRPTPQTAEPPGSARVRRILRDNGLSLVLLGLFLLFLLGQVLTGRRAFNADQREHGQPEATLAEYVSESHFAEATAENWESEFLQMAAYVWLTAFLFQRGSAESNDPDGKEGPRPARVPRRAPWPVRRGGVVRRVYERSLSLAFALLFATSFTLHAAAGAAHYSTEQLAHGGEPVTAWAYVRTSQFWFESFQNWQSEFLAILAMIVLSIFLRQKGSPESKEVERPHAETGA